MNTETNISKPVVKLIGEDGNIFNLIGICKSEMRRAKVPNNVIDEMIKKVFNSGSYDEALMILDEYCEIE